MDDLYYIMDDDHNTVPVNLITWSEWFATHDRTIKKQRFGDILVSTVFLGLSHNGDLFETMIFGPGLREIYCTRNVTYIDAEVSHSRAIIWLRETLINTCKEIESRS